MKYLIHHKREFTITVVALIVAILDMFKVITGIDLGICEDSILAIVSAIMGVLCWFYHMPTSFEGDIAKKEIKQMKSLRGEYDCECEEPEDSEVI